MTFSLQWTAEGRKNYDELKQKASENANSRKKKGKDKSSLAEELFKQVVKTLKLLCSSPRHPGLHTHEYSSIPHPWDSDQKVFEAYAQNKTPGAYRVFWCYGPKDRSLIIIAITPHP